MIKFKRPVSDFSGSEIGSEKSSEIIFGMFSKNNKINAKQIAGQLNLSSRAVEKHIAKLKVNGKLKRIGSAKGGHWEVID